MTRHDAKLHGVVFDLDGLLIDTEPLQYRAFAAVFADFGVSLSLHEFQALLGRRTNEIIESVARRKGMATPLTLLRKQRDQVYRDLLLRHASPMPGASELLRAVIRSRLKVAIASSSGSSDVATCASILGIEAGVIILVTGDDVSRGKPDPEIYRQTLVRLALDATQCVAVEDSEVGINAAVAARLAAIAVPNQLTREQDFSRADLVVGSLAELSVAALSMALSMS